MQKPVPASTSVEGPGISGLDGGAAPKFSIANSRGKAADKGEFTVPSVERAQQIAALRSQVSSLVIGQEKLVERLLIALICGGHLLVEGPPGVAKTRAIRSLAGGIEADFHRIQFTPDLLPSDITGTEIYRPETGSFEFRQGPVFHNLVLADEINRAPAKVQTALLEAMAERQVSVGRVSYPLPDLFLVMATRNPIEQEGTYPLPEAQLDRFLLHTFVGYPDSLAEGQILDLVEKESQEAAPAARERLAPEVIFAVRQELLQLHVSDAVREYMIQLVRATREPNDYDANLGRYVDYGASPRGTLALASCSRALAWLSGRDFVTPEDVREIAHDALRHRLVMSLESEAERFSADDLIGRLLELVPTV